MAVSSEEKNPDVTQPIENLPEQETFLPPSNQPTNLPSPEEPPAKSPTKTKNNKPEVGKSTPTSKKPIPTPRHLPTSEQPVSPVKRRSSPLTSPRSKPPTSPSIRHRYGVASPRNELSFTLSPGRLSKLRGEDSRDKIFGDPPTPDLKRGWRPDDDSQEHVCWWRPPKPTSQNSLSAPNLSPRSEELKLSASQSEYRLQMADNSEPERREKGRRQCLSARDPLRMDSAFQLPSNTKERLFGQVDERPVPKPRTVKDVYRSTVFDMEPVEHNRPTQVQTARNPISGEGIPLPTYKMNRWFKLRDQARNPITGEDYDTSKIMRVRQ